MIPHHVYSLLMERGDNLSRHRDLPPYGSMISPSAASPFRQIKIVSPVEYHPHTDLPDGLQVRLRCSRRHNDRRRGRHIETCEELHHKARTLVLRKGPERTVLEDGELDTE